MGRLIEAMSAAGRRDSVWPMDPVFLPYFSADARARMAAGQPVSHLFLMASVMALTNRLDVESDTDSTLTP